MLMPLRWPFWLRRTLSVLLRGINQRAAEAIGNFHTNTHELLLVYQEIENYWLAWKKLMKEQQFDAIICPIFVSLHLSFRSKVEWLIHNVLAGSRNEAQRAL